MLTDLVRRMLGSMPSLKRALWQAGYQAIARRYPGPDFLFMNYGYEMAGERGPDLAPEDEPHRLFIQLYHRVVRSVDLRGRDVLEVGSGRGGGASYLWRYHGPRRVVGLDFAARAVALAQAAAASGPTFVAADAEAIPFREASFDAVVNVESSACYPSMARFLAEVRRVLKTGGHLLFADFRTDRSIATLRTELAGSGLALLAADDITRAVLAALGLDSDRRDALIRATVPPGLRRLAAMFAGVRGFPAYQWLESGRGVYLACVLRKETEG